MADTQLPFGTRIWFAWACFFRVLADGQFAARAWDAQAAPRLEEAKPWPKVEEPKPKKKPKPVDEAVERPKPVDGAPALQLLALLQREGRFVDFVQQDLGDNSDADIGAAARVVHEGCRKALKGHVTIEPVRTEEEGARVKLDVDYDRAAVKLTGKVEGAGPHEGTLRHRGWRASELKLPAIVAGHDANILAPAEVEL